MPPVKVRRPVSHTTRTGKVGLSKFVPSHTFQGSKTQPVKQSQENAMPTGMPLGELSPPQNPLDVIAGGPSRGPVTDVPSGNTLMQPATQWSRPSMGQNMPQIQQTTGMVNTNMMRGRMPAGPRAAQPLLPGLAKGAGFVVGQQLVKALTQVPAEKQSAAFEFGSDIAKHMRPRTATRQESTHRGDDMRKGLANIC